MYQIEDRAIALAGIFSAASLVHQLAATGSANNSDIAGLTNSIFITDPDSVSNVYPDKSCLKEGLACIQGMTNGSTHSLPIQVAHYTSNLIQLAKISLTEPDLLETIANRIKFIDPANSSEGAADQLDYGTPYLYSQIDNLYKDTLSNLNFRIQVQGEPHNLQNTEIASQIRTSLMAGFRAAHLWQQIGGRRWHLMFKRKAYSLAAQNILDQLTD